MNKSIKGNTKLFAVIGYPISHSLSPEIHNSFLELTNKNVAYIPLNIKPEELSQAIPMLKSNFKGFNITIPHKEKIISFLDELDDKAKIYGAVNTVKVEDGKLIGFNTDGHGFLRGLEIEGIQLEGKDVLLIGAGGAAKVIAYEIITQGGNLTIANRNIDRAKELKNDLLCKYQDKVNISSIDDIKGNYHIIINSTPVGMYPNENKSPIDLKLLRGTEVVYDIIYNPYHTKLLQDAKSLGCKVLNGFSMLFHQALKAQEIWTGAKLSIDEEKKLFLEIENYFLNNL